MYAIDAASVLLEDDVFSGAFGVDFEEAGEVAATVAVAGGGPDGGDVFVVEELLIALLHELVGAGDE